MQRYVLKNRISRTDTLRRAIALLLCLCLAAPVFSPRTHAADAPAQPENTYLLRVDTGIDPGDQVQYIAIRYEDDRGIPRTHFLFPHEGSEADGLAIAEAAGSVSSRVELVKKVTGYSPEGMDALSSLKSDSHDEFLFSPYFPFKKLLSVDVYQTYEAGAKGWTCAGMEFFKVTSLYGVGMSGYYSSDYFIDFDGELLYSFATDGTVHQFSLSNSDELTVLGASERSGYYDMDNRRGDKYSTGHDQEFIFEVDFADVYEAGIEALATPVADHRPALTELGVAELLNLCISYQDVSGATRTVNLPVITSTLAWAVENGMLTESSQLAGVAQQGENLMFAGRLPGYKSLVSCQLNYGLDADRRSGISHSGTFTIGGKTYDDPRAAFAKEGYADLTKDRIALSGVRLYYVSGKGADSVSYMGSGSDLFFETKISPAYLYLSGSAYGDTVSPGAPKNLNLAPCTGDELEPTAVPKDRYLVEIETDNVSFANTADEIQAVFYYTTTSGTSRSTNPVKLSEGIKDYFGYWPGTEGNYAYTYAAAAGSRMGFYLDLPDVSQFDAVEFFMDSHSADDWQLRSVAIYKPTWIGRRTVRWQDHASGGASTDRVYSRAFDTDFPMRIYGREAEQESVYINGNSPDSIRKRIDFDSNSTGTVADDVDWSDIRYSMTYKEAMQDFGFTRARATYEVKVKVAGNEDANAVDGDCGSNNLFFFQLIFRNGSSGFVLANQQLTADGFRAGQTETFTIQTNQDYGELDSIRVLPADVDEENTDIFDKLKIDTISVIKKDNSSLARTWKAENVGWIEIDYSDQAAASGITGKKGRTYEQIARDFPITYQGFSQKLLFVISTGPYEKELDYNGQPVEGSDLYPSLEGNVTATVYYNDGTPGTKEQSVDLVRAMYDYNEQPPKTDADTGKGLIDSNVMFRATHEDRFFVTLDDVRKVLGMRLEVRAKNSTVWRVNGVSVYQVNADGSLRINSRGEYQRNTDDDLTAVTFSDEAGYTVKTTADGAEQTQIIDFDDNDIVVKENDDHTWTSTISREPENKNDTLNIYVHTFAGDGASPASAYELKATVQYYDKYREQPMALEVKQLNRNADEGVFYATELYASGMSNLQSMTLRLNSADAAMAYIDYAVVQHVRSGVVVGSYFLDFNGSLVGEGIRAFPESDASILNHEKQTVRLFFTPDTKASPLSEERTDIAVALRYTSTNDATNKEYTSPYVFLTDVREPDSALLKYPSIAPGMVAELNFHVNFVKDITGIQIVQVGGLSSAISGATAATYDVSGEIPEMRSWVNFADGHTLSHTPVTLTPTETNVVPVEIELKTAMSIDTMGTGTSDPIRMTLSYTNMADTTPRTLVIDDIRDYLVSGSFDSGATAVLSFFLEDVGRLRSVTLEPRGTAAYSKAVWGLETIRVSMLRNGVPEVIERTLTGSDGLIMEGQPKTVSMTNIVLSTLTTFYNSKVHQQNAVNSGADGKSSVLIYSGDEVTIGVTLEGSLPGYGYTVSAVMDRGGASTQVTCFGRDGNKIVFTPPKNTSGSDDVYIVTISSDENPDVKATVEIHVESEPEQEPTPAPSPESREETPPGETPGDETRHD